MYYGAGAAFASTECWLTRPFAPSKAKRGISASVLCASDLVLWYVSFVKPDCCTSARTAALIFLLAAGAAALSGQSLEPLPQDSE